MKKKARDEVARLLSQSPPSAAAIRWDASVSVSEYIQRAASTVAQTEERLSAFKKAALPDVWFGEEIRQAKIADRLLYEAKFQLSPPRYGMLQLLNTNNWRSTRPTISVVAEINQQGNFVTKWATPFPPSLRPPRYQLENNTGFKEDFFLECWHNTEPFGNRRPASELLWFRHFPLSFDEGEHPAVRYIMYAIRAEFDAMINQIRASLNVTASPSIAFIRDDETGLEMTVS